MDLAISELTGHTRLSPAESESFRHLVKMTLKCSGFDSGTLISVEGDYPHINKVFCIGQDLDDWLIANFSKDQLLRPFDSVLEVSPTLPKEIGCVTIRPLPVDGIYSLVLILSGTMQEITQEDQNELDELLVALQREVDFHRANIREKGFQEIVESLGDMIFELDENGMFTYVNPAILKVTGYTREEIMQKRHVDIIEPDNTDAAVAYFMQKIRAREPMAYYESNIRTKTGQSIYIGLNLQFVYKGDWVVKTYAVARDITRLQETQYQLQQSEEKYRLISENSQDLIIVYELDGSFKYISSSVNDLLEYDPNDLIGKRLSDIIHEDDFIDFFEGEEREKLVSNQIRNDELRLKVKEGDFIWFESYTKPLFDGFGALSGFQSFFQDISVRKQQELKLQKTDEELNHYKEGLKLLNEITSNTALTQEQQISQALWASTEFLMMENGVLSEIKEQDFQIKHLYGNDAGFAQGEQYPLEETFSEVVFKKNDLVAIEEISTTTYSVHPCHKRFNIESYIGMPYYVAGKRIGTISFSSPTKRNKPFTDNDFEYIKLLSRWIGFILQHQQYEKNLMQDKIILQAFVSNAPAAIAMFDTEMRYITASDKWYDDYNLADEYIIGRSYFELFPDIGQDWDSIFKKAMTGSIESNEQDLIEKADGTIQWIKWEVRPWYKALDTVGGLIMFTEDISLQKEQQLQLKIAKRKAEQASKAKEQFLSTMSHEIRTPLNAIIGMTEVMLMDEQEEEQQKRLELLKFSGKNLLVLINDILDFNKIEAGKLEFEIANFNLKNLLEKIRESLLGLAEKKNLAFKLSYDPELPEFVKGDSVRVAQIITNLTNNSIKFTEEGSVHLKVNCLRKDSERCAIKFEVEDTGIGIPKDKLETIFQSFEQANAAITRKYGGSGLGLAITKKILAMMGSQIQVESTEGVGSTFFFEIELPIGEVEQAEHIVVDQAEINENVHLLVVEDNPGNRVLIESLFKKWKLSFDFAFNGLQAVEKIQQRPYDMVLMDLQMPEMDGYEATKNIRAMKDDQYRDIPIIALTASVMSNVLEKTKEVGMNGYLSKPFNPVELKNTIAAYTSGIRKEKEVQESSSTVDFPYLTSLVGDDAKTLTEIIRTTVESVISAAHGINEGMESADIDKVRSELHVLRPNLHNLELGNLTAELPKIRELTEENLLILRELVHGIEKSLNENRITKYLA